MRSAAANVIEVDATLAVDKFALELSELGRRYGIAIGDQPSLFLMESDDYKFDYKVDKNGRLSIG